AKWTYPTFQESQTGQWIDQAVKQRESRQDAVLPAFFPVAATVRSDKGSLPLLIYRSHWGVHARDLSKDGKLAWDSPSSGSLDSLVADQEKKMQLDQWQWVQLYMNTNSNFLFENSTIGTLSTDNKYVYIVDDLALPPHPSSQPMQQLMWGQPPMFGRLQDLIFHSRLKAYDLRTGKFKWELGGRAVDKDESTDKGKLSDCYFLGPPLPVGD